MVSQTTEYGLRAMVFLATDPTAPRTTQEVAAATQVPPGYASKVLNALTKSGLVRSQRGLGGGFSLTRAPKDVTVLDVVRVFEPVRRIDHCPLGIPTHAQLCPLHRRLDDAARTIEEAFASTTLKQLIEEAPDRPPLCDASALADERTTGAPESTTSS